MATGSQMNVEYLDDGLECPICLDLMSIPIVQCKSGHSMCKAGSSQLELCPICRGIMAKTRNFALENIIKTWESGNNDITRTCKYYKNGCNFFFALQNEKNAHELLECKFRDFPCEIAKFCGANCDWYGSIKDVSKHFRHRHEEFEVCNDDVDNFYLDFHDRDRIGVDLLNYERGGRYFWCKWKSDAKAQKFYYIIQLIGPKTLSELYNYEFKLCDPNYSKQIAIRETCESDLTNVDEILEKENCVVLPFKTLKRYLVKDNQLMCSLRLWKKY